MRLKLLLKDVVNSEVFFTPACAPHTKWLAFILATLASIQIMGFITFDTYLLYIGVCLISVIYCMLGGFVKFKPQYIFLYFVFALNVLLLPIAPCFNSQLRLLQFFIVTLAFSACISSNKAIIFRRYLFKYILMYMCALSIGSFFAFFLGINCVYTSASIIPEYSVLSVFGGLTNHSMVLGPVSMVSVIVFYVMYQTEKSPLAILLFFVCAMAAVMAASRAALLGIAVAILFSLLLMKKSFSGNKKSFITIICVSALVALPIADKVFVDLINKQEQRSDSGGAFSSRQSKFDCRINEFIQSPILGVGFASIDPNGGDDYNSVTGQIEPGSSHLAVLSMTGLLGLFGYVLLLISAYRTSRVINSVHAQLSSLLFIAFFTHAWFEGYVLSAGGYMSMCYWLIIGQNFDSKYLFK